MCKEIPQSCPLIKGVGWGEREESGFTKNAH